jgi:hypothetical protein
MIADDPHSEYNTTLKKGVFGGDRVDNTPRIYTCQEYIGFLLRTYLSMKWRLVSDHLFCYSLAMKNTSAPLESWHSPEGRKIKDSVLGINDGLVTVVSFIGGLTGSALPMHMIFFSGVMSNIAGAISMFLGGYMAARSQRDS